MLQLVNIEFMFSKIILVLKGISINVPAGKVVALLGSNGAGKTTTINAICGLLHSEDGEVTDGHILYENMPIEQLDPTDIVRIGILPVLSGRKVIKHLTIEQNLLVGSHLRPDMKAVNRTFEKVYGYCPRLKQLKDRIAGYLSGGEQQLLVIARALMADPKLMLFDEPSMGLAPLLVKETFRILETLNKEENMTMLLVEQNARIALSIASYGYLLENGRIVLEGSAQALGQNEDIKEFYLGLSLSGGRKNYRKIKHYKRRKRWLG